MKKVLFIASSQDWYPRNIYLINLLKETSQVDIIMSSKKTWPFRIISVILKFIFKKNKNKYDFIVVGFLSPTIIPFVRFCYRKKIINDFFISIYDTLCNDRKIINKKTLLAKIIYHYEKWTLNLSNHIITDTESTKTFFTETFNLSPQKISVLYALPDKERYLNYPEIINKDEKLKIFFYGSCQPLHGIDVILKTANLLKNNNIEFVLIGPIRKKYSKLISKLDLSNVTFKDWVKYEDLPKYINSSDICLGGHFSSTEKAKRVIAGKTFQFMLMKKANILGNNQANKELFTNEQNCLMIEINNPEKLVQAILQLKNDKNLRNEIAINGYNITQKIYDINKKNFEKLSKA